MRTVIIWSLLLLWAVLLIAPGCSGKSRGRARTAGLRPCPLATVDPSINRIPCKKIGNKWYRVD